MIPEDGLSCDVDGCERPSYRGVRVPPIGSGREREVVVCREHIREIRARLGLAVPEREGSQ